MFDRAGFWKSNMTFDGKPYVFDEGTYHVEGDRVWRHMTRRYFESEKGRSRDFPGEPDWSETFSVEGNMLTSPASEPGGKTETLTRSN